MYTIERTVAFSETGPDNRIKITNLLDYYQDVCTFQSEDLGIGTRYLRERGIGWVASSWQVIVNRYPELDEKIRVGTAPYEFKAAMGMRNFRMETMDGEVLSVANSIWSMINIESKMLIRAPKELMETYALEEKLDMDYAPRKITDPTELTALPPVTVQYHHLDSNGHVNNAQYVAVAEDLFPEIRRARQIRVEYRSSARPGDLIMPYIAHDEAAGTCTIVLADTGSKPYVLIECVTGTVL